VILADQVKNLDWAIRDAELICRLSRSTIIEVLEKINVLLSFED
jgi:mRNA interferase MazF